MENVAHLTGTAAAPRRLGRSTGAVVAGFLTVLVTHTGTDAVMHATGVFPPVGQTMSGGLFGLALAYRCVFTILGGYVTGRLAPHRPVKHGIVLGGIGFLASLIGLAVALSHPELGPTWYPILIVLTSLPCTWFGAKLSAG